MNARRGQNAAVGTSGYWRAPRCTCWHLLAAHVSRAALARSGGAAGSSGNAGVRSPLDMSLCPLQPHHRQSPYSTERSAVLSLSARSARSLSPLRRVRLCRSGVLASPLMSFLRLGRADSEPGAEAAPLAQPALLRHRSAPLPRQVVDFDAVLGAAYRGDVLTVVLALRKGLPVNFADSFERSMLYAASLCGHLALLRTLLACGASDDVRKRRCFKNALNKDVQRLLAPMYEAEELREQLGVPEPPARYQVPEHLEVKLAPVAAPAPAREVDSVEVSLRRVAEALQLSEEGTEALLQQVDEGDPLDLVGSFADGKLMRRDLYEQIDWGSWPVRYAQWLLESNDRQLRFAEWRRKTRRGGAGLREHGPVQRAPATKNPAAKNRRARRSEAQAKRQSEPGSFGRTRRWREPNQAGVLLTTFTPEPRLYHHIEVPTPTTGAMTIDRLLEHYPGDSHGSYGSGGRGKKGAACGWRRNPLATGSYERSRSYQKNKKKETKARQRNRDLKVEEQTCY
eukprot:scaffold878_cov271-Pinguiococcus_pyrenoidosus.AAC.66